MVLKVNPLVTNWNMADGGLDRAVIWEEDTEAPQVL